MTQEEIQQKAYEVYPLDLDRHMIIEGEPYDNNKEKREAYIRGLTDSKPSLPSNLDEAAEEYIKFKPRYDIQQELEEGEDPTEIECFTIDAAIDSFKAGAEWMAGQGETQQHFVIGSIADSPCGPAVVCYTEEFSVGDEVIVQIRKK